MDVFFVMRLDGVLALPLAGTGQQAHHCHYSGENSESYSCIRLLLQHKGNVFLWPTKRSANCKLENGDIQCSDIT